MNTRTLSPADALLLDYAAGRLTTVESLLMAAHIALNADARRRVAQFEAAAAQMLHDEDECSVSAACLGNIFRAIDARPAPCADDRHDDGFYDALGVPPPVRHLLSFSCQKEAPQWHSMAEGVEVVDLCVMRTGCRRQRHRLRLMRCAPRRAVPAHSHQGREIMLVLAGGFEDHSGHYAAGDMLVIEDPQVSHAPTTEDDGCLCLMLTDAPLRFDALVARIFNIFQRF